MRAAFDVGASRPVAPGPFRSSARLASRIKTTNAHRACRSGWDVADLVPRVSRGARPLNAVGRNAEGRASDAGHPRPRPPPRARLAAALAAATLAWSAPALAEEALAAASPEGSPHGNATETRASGTGANATEPGLAPRRAFASVDQAIEHVGKVDVAALRRALLDAKHAEFARVAGPSAVAALAAKPRGSARDEL